MRLFAFHGGGEIVDEADLGPTEAPYFFYVVEHPDGKVLFDSGGHPDLVDRPAEHLGPEVAAMFEITMRPGDDAASKLQAAGFAATDITHVVQSHLHYDHAGGLFQFPHAEAYVQRAELAAVLDPPPGQVEFYCAKDYEDRADWTVLDGEHDLFGDGRVVVVPTPGHTAGHQSLVVRLDGGAYILAADVAYRPEQFEERRLSSVYSDADAMLASYERIATIRDELGAEVIFTHDLSWRETIRVAPGAWYE